MLEITRSVLDALDNSKTIALATVIDVEGPSSIKLGTKLLVQQDGTILRSVGDEKIDAIIAADCQRQISEGIETNVVTYDLPVENDAAPKTRLDVYIEVIYGQPTILIVGAGHIGYHLSKLAKLLRYQVVILDDRPDFANRERFPEADEVIAADMIETLSTMSVRPTTYVVLVPRGHGYTEDALGSVINSPTNYIGMIGSRARANTILSNLKQAGVSQEKIDRVYAPVGLRIGAQTPEEIALSILAEIVKVRQGGDAESSRDRVKETKHV